MKTTTYADGSQLKISETAEDEQQLLLESPNPFLANRARQIDHELRKLDPDLPVELVTQPYVDSVTDKIVVKHMLYVRDMSIFPPRLMQWEMLQEQMQYDDCAVQTARVVFDYWQRKRAART